MVLKPALYKSVKHNIRLGSNYITLERLLARKEHSINMIYVHVILVFTFKTV